MSKPSSLTLGPIELHVADLDLLTHFYTEVVGLEILEKHLDTIVLGNTDHPLLVLEKRSLLPSSHPSHAGLYHFALLFSSRGDLARTISRILLRTSHLFSGSADHLVSEAFYFNDPEGNGIELYFDRDRTGWEWEDGEIKMASLYLDPASYIESFLPLKEEMSTIAVGHIHLKVGDIEKARIFYEEVLGFDVTAKLPGALFVSVAGYHHHIGLNTWESAGASKRKETLGLKSFTFLFPNPADQAALEKRLEENQIPFDKKEKEITFHDPWMNQIVARAA